MSSKRGSDYERELVKACVEKSAMAKKELAETYAPGMTRAIRKALGREANHPEFVDDILQNTWLDLFKDDCRLLAMYDPARKVLAAFLAGCARLRSKHFLDEYRREITFKREVLDEAARVHREAEERHDEADFHEFKTTLPPRLLRFLQEELLARQSSETASEISDDYRRQMKSLIRRRLRDFGHDD